MNIPVGKNRSWIAHLHKGIDQLGERRKAAVMMPAGMACASDLILLCEEHLGSKVETIEDLVAGWNMVREEGGLTGKWHMKGHTVMAIFAECGCPLVRTGLIELHPVQCYCSQGLMETIFSHVTKRAVGVEIRRTIGRSDDVCEFVITI